MLTGKATKIYLTVGLTKKFPKSKFLIQYIYIYIYIYIQEYKLDIDKQV